jgi:hypothetical protein
MTTVFPGAIDFYTTKVDSVTQVLASHVNDLQDAVVAIETVVIAQSPNPNLLYHTLTHDIWMTGTTFNDVSDDSYVATLWNALWNGNAPDVSGVAVATPFFGAGRHLKCLFDTNGSQAGFAQFLTAQDTYALRGKTVTFSIDAVGANVANLRCAIIGWAGTADSLTSDVVGTWSTGNPTLATNWSYLSDSGTPQDQALSGGSTVDRLECTATIPYDNTVNNLAVFVWTPDQEDNGDYFLLARAKLEIASSATGFVNWDMAIEQALLVSFYNKSYLMNITPGSASDPGAIGWQTRVAIAASTAGTLRPQTPKYPRMRVAPSIVIYSPATGTSGAVRNDIAANDRTGCTAVNISDTGFQAISVSNASANAIALDEALRLHFVADARL